MMHPNHPLAVWLTSSGIDPAMGGIASVTRSCLEALAPGEFPEAGPAPGGAMRFICLQNPPDREAEDCAGKLRNRFCRGSRLRFLFEVALQVFHRPALILFEHVDLAQCQTLLPRPRRCPYAVWGHGIELWRALPARKEEALREADLLLFNSSFTREKAATFHPWILDRPYRVIPLCRGKSGETESPSAFPDSSSRKPDILTVGRLVEDRPKGHLEILAAMPEILAKSPRTHWHIAGSGPWGKTLEAKIKEASMESHITMHGFVDEEKLEQLFQSSRVFAMPSHGEGFGLVYAEAMSHGLPCIGSNLDAAPEVIGDDGWIVDPADGASLTNTLLIPLLADETEFSRYSKVAKERSLFFNQDRFSRDLREALADSFL